MRQRASQATRQVFYGKGLGDKFGDGDWLCTSPNGAVQHMPAQENGYARRCRIPIESRERRKKYAHAAKIAEL